MIMNGKSVKERLFDEPYRFEFFQAVRLLENIFPERKPVGGDALPADEVVRFRSFVSLEFPPSEIRDIRQVADNLANHAFSENLDSQKRIEMLICVIGMVGISGVLPTHYTELVLDRIKHRDTALWTFLDIFTHRAASLFYRAWAKYRFPIGYERGEDEFTGYLFDFAGLGTKGLRGRLAVDDETLLPYVGLIAQRPHSTNSVTNIIADYFGVPVKIEQFAGQWLELEPSDQTFVGRQNSRLGVNTIAGTRIWDQQSKFRIRLGPLEFRKFQAFLPNGSAYRPLKSIVSFMTGMELDFDFRLVLEKRQVPSTILTTRALRRPMLGWTSFLKTQPKTADDDQLILQPN
ncbi:MAG: type VI secretion system baseplate subunit TssG [Blastocatellia bacterium]